MLVLSRRIGERVLIGRNVEIVVAEVRGDRVKLGFECPPEVRVLREELQWRDSPEAIDERKWYERIGGQSYATIGETWP